jgi:MoaA/NifB/PqqE/SkfB family radical SAM enzyme
MGEKIKTTAIFFFLTKPCNLSCAYCYVSAEPRLHRTMTIDVSKKAIIHVFGKWGEGPRASPHFGD